MKKTVFIAVFIAVFVSGCSSSNYSSAEKTESVNQEIIQLKQNNDELLKQMDTVIEKVSFIENKLAEKNEEIKTLKMDIDELYNTNDAQEKFYKDSMEEIVRLYTSDELTERKFMIKKFDLENFKITVENQLGETHKYPVSQECKVLVAGQSHIIFQKLEVGLEFINYTIKTQDKVIIVLKNGVVEQIKMYSSNW